MVFNTPRVLLLALTSALVANAAIYVTQPPAGSTCHGGQSCTISWLDDGQAPLLSSIGLSRVGLYTGDLQLVQTIQPVNVDEIHSLTFTPNPKAGPNSNSYYIAFIPVSDSSYTGYSPWFSLDNMSGSFASPDPAATSSLPLPSGSGAPTGGQTTTTETSTETTVSSSGSTPKATSTVAPTATTEGLTTTGATETTSSGFNTIRTTTSGSPTRATASSSPTNSNAAISNSVPATGFAWALLAFLGATLL